MDDFKYISDEPKYISGNSVEDHVKSGYMKKIKDFPQYYACRDGKVWSSKSNKFLLKSISDCGYEQIGLYVEGKQTLLSIRYLIAQTFISNPDNLKYLNHIDGCKLNNNVNNLEWMIYLNNNLNHEDHVKSGYMKKIKDFPQYYACQDGKVWSSKSNKFLSKLVNKCGYEQIGLRAQGLRNKNIFTVHRIIAQTFIPNPNNLKCVNHIDGCKTNNNINNLEWITQQNNVKHAVKHNLRNTYKRPVLCYSMDNKFIKRYDSVIDAGKILNIKTPSNIRTVCGGKQKSCHGFLWKYEKEISVEIPIDIDEWKCIPSFNNYKISKDGKVWSIKSNKFLKPTKISGNYAVNLPTKMVFIHRLVALTYIPNPSNFKHVQYLDNNKSNNNVNNLRWSTRGDSFTRGPQNSKKVNKIDSKGNIIAQFSSCSEAERFMNNEKNHSNISACCRGKKPLIYGYRWAYSDDKV